MKSGNDFYGPPSSASSHSEGWRKLRNVGKAVHHLKNPPVYGSPVNTDTTSFRNVLLKLRRTRPAATTLKGKGRATEHVMQQYLQKLGVLLSRYAYLGYLPEWRLVIADLSMPFSAHHLTQIDQLLSLQLLDVLSKSYATSSPQETLARWLLLIKALNSPLSEVVSITLRLIARVIHPSATPLPSGPLSLRALLASLISVNASLKRQNFNALTNQAIEWSDQFIVSLSKGHCVDLEADNSAIAFLENLTFIAFTRQDLRKFILLNLFPKVWQKHVKVSVLDEVIPTLGYLSRIVQQRILSPVEQNEAELQAIVDTILPTFQSQAMTRASTELMTASLTLFICLHSVASASRQISLATFTHSLLTQTSSKKCIKAVVEHYKESDLPWQYFASTALSFPSLSARLIPIIFYKMDTNQDRAVLSEIATKNPQDFYKCLFDLNSTVFDSEASMITVIEQIKRMACAVGVAEFYFPASNCELLLVLLFLAETQQTSAPDSISGKQAILLLFTSAIDELESVEEHLKSGHKKRLRDFITVLDPRLAVMLRNKHRILQPNALSNSDQAYLLLFLHTIYLSCGVARKPEWIPTLTTWTKTHLDISNERELLIPDYFALKLKCFSFSMISIKLCAAMYAYIELTDYESLAQQLWSQLELFPMELTIYAIFLILQFGERHNRLLKLINVDIQSSLIEQRRLALGRIALIFSHRHSLTTVENVCSRKPFKADARPTSVFATEIGSSSPMLPSEAKRSSDILLHNEARDDVSDTKPSDLFLLPPTFVFKRIPRRTGREHSALMRRESSTASNHEQSATLPSSLVAMLHACIVLLRDPCTSVSWLAQTVVFTWLVEVPNQLLGPLLQASRDDDDQAREEALSRLSLLAKQGLPPSAAYIMFNQAIGSIKVTFRDSPVVHERAKARELPVAAMAIPHVANLTIKELKKSKIESLLIFTGNAFNPGDSPQSLHFFTVHVAQLQSMIALLSAGSRDDAYSLKTMIGQLQLPPLIFSPADLRLDSSLYDFVLASKQLCLVWIQMLQDLLLKLSTHFGNKEELGKLLDTGNYILQRHFQDAEVVANIGKLFITAASRFHRLFATRAAFVFVVPSLVEAYTSVDSSAATRAAITVIWDTFYQLHRESFAVQALRCIAGLPKANGKTYCELFLVGKEHILSDLTLFSGVESIDAAQRADISNSSDGNGERFILKVITTAITAEGVENAVIVKYAGLLCDAVPILVTVPRQLCDTLEALFNLAIEAKGSPLVMNFQEQLILILIAILESGQPLRAIHTSLYATVFGLPLTPGSLKLASVFLSLASHSTEVDGLIEDLHLVAPIFHKCQAVDIDRLCHPLIKLLYTDDWRIEHALILYDLIVKPAFQRRLISSKLAELSAILCRYTSIDFAALFDGAQQSTKIEPSKNLIQVVAVPFIANLCSLADANFEPERARLTTAWLEALQFLIASTTLLSHRLNALCLLVIKSHQVLESTVGAWSALAEFFRHACPCSSLDMDWLSTESAPSPRDFAFWALSEFLVAFRTPLRQMLRDWLQEAVTPLKAFVKQNAMTRSLSGSSSTRSLHSAGTSPRLRFRSGMPVSSAVDEHPTYIDLQRAPSLAERGQVRQGLTIQHLGIPVKSASPTTRSVVSPLPSAVSSSKHSLSRHVALLRICRVQDYLDGRTLSIPGFDHAEQEGFVEWQEAEALHRILEALEEP